MNRQRGMALGWMYLIGAAGVLVALSGAVYGIYNSGYEKGRVEAEAACKDAARKQREKEAKSAETAAITLEAGNAKAKVTYRTITKQVDKIIDRPVYRNICLDADGLSSVNAALRGEGTIADKPDGRVPESNAVR